MMAGLVGSTSRRSTTLLCRYWPLWLALAAAVVAATLGLQTSLARVAVKWQHYAYEHSWVVVGMTAWSLAREMRRAQVSRVGPSVIGVAALGAVMLAYVTAEVLDISLGMSVLLPLIMLAGIAALAGLQVARVVALPIALLYFTIPVWEELTIPFLQLMTIKVVSSLLAVTGPPTLLTDNVITVPAGSFEIVGGCAGMAYFLVGLTLAAFYGISWYTRWRTRLLLIAFAGAMAIVSNWIRVYTLVLIGDATHMQHYFIRVNHESYGWAVFMLAMLPVLGFAQQLERREARTMPANAGLSSVPPALAPGGVLLASSIAVCALLCAPVFLRTGWTGGTAASVPVALLPNGVPGWRSTVPLPGLGPEFRSPYFSKLEAFVSDRGIQVDLFIVRYLRQQPEAKLVTSHDQLLQDWKVRRTDSPLIEIGSRRGQVLQQEAQKPGDEWRLVRSWFVIGGRPTHSRLRAKFLELPALFSGRRDGTLVAVSAVCAADCQGAAAALDAFLRESGNQLDAIAGGALDKNGNLH